MKEKGRKMMCFRRKKEVMEWYQQRPMEKLDLTGELSRDIEKFDV